MPVPVYEAVVVSAVRGATNTRYYTGKSETCAEGGSYLVLQYCGGEHISLLTTGVPGTRSRHQPGTS
jgi:hypothetical protein